MFVLFHHHIYMVVTGQHPTTDWIPNEPLNLIFECFTSKIFRLKLCPRHPSQERQKIDEMW